MTHMDDLHEANDREPVPDERDGQPVNLDQVAAALAAYRQGIATVCLEEPHQESTGDQAASFLLDEALPPLIAELRDARERLARWEALPTTDEWAVTDDRSTPPRDGLRFTADAALAIAARDGRQAWRQTRISRPAVIRPWEPIDADSPF